MFENHFLRISQFHLSSSVGQGETYCACSTTNIHKTGFLGQLSNIPHLDQIMVWSFAKIMVWSFSKIMVWSFAKIMIWSFTKIITHRFVQKLRAESVHLEESLWGDVECSSHKFLLRSNCSPSVVSCKRVSFPNIDCTALPGLLVAPRAAQERALEHQILF